MGLKKLTLAADHSIIAINPNDVTWAKDVTDPATNATPQTALVFSNARDKVVIGHLDQVLLTLGLQ